MKEKLEYILYEYKDYILVELIDATWGHLLQPNTTKVFVRK